MKSLNTILISLLIFVQGCEQNDGPGPTLIEVPTSMTVISGDNQTGYPNLLLPDSIIIEIAAHKQKDFMKYSYYFKNAQYGNWAPSKSYIKNNRLYISFLWQLSNQTTQQELKFYLTEKCEQNYYPSNCRILDSLSIKALIKHPWVQILSDSSSPLYDIHFSDDENGIVVGDRPFSPGYLKTNDGGETWTSAINSRNDLYQLSFCSSDTGIVIVSNNYAYFTNDGGQSFYLGEWTPPITGHRSSSDYFMQNSKTILSVGRKGTIAKTVDGGKSWVTYPGFNFINYLYSITCPGHDVCYACGEAGKVVKTMNGGETWFEQEVFINNYLKTIYFLDEYYGFSAGQSGALIRTTDGGGNWEIIKTGLRSTIIEIHFDTKDAGYLVSETGEIAHTTDGGKTWTLINKDYYGVSDLTKTCFKGLSIWGLQDGSIYKYDLNGE